MIKKGNPGNPKKLGSENNLEISNVFKTTKDSVYFLTKEMTDMNDRRELQKNMMDKTDRGK